MKFEMSDKDQVLKVYNYLVDTREFIGAGDVYIPPHTGLPANCTLTPPPETPTGQVAVFDEEASTWSLTEDHRGQTVYDASTGMEISITSLGPLPADSVTTPPDGAYEKWDGSQWVKDAAAEKTAQISDAQQTKYGLASEANNTVELLQDAVDLDMATDDEKSQLTAWKKYRVLLSRVNPEDAPDIDWPKKPE